MNDRKRLTIITLLFFGIAFSQTVDTTFGNNGIVVTELSNSVDGIYSTVLQTDGKILALGSANGYLGVTRYTSDGALDTSFGNAGILISSMRSGFFNFVGGDSDIELLPNGKILLLGLNTIGNVSYMQMLRYSINGTLDIAFGTNGLVNISSLSSFSTSTFTNAMKVLPNGKILVTAYNQSDEIYLLKFNPNGNLDTTFGTNGISTIPIPIGYNVPFYARDLCLQPSGNILLTASITVSATQNTDFLLLQFNDNGELNSNFGTNGFVITDMGTNNDVPSTIKLQGDGKIVISGTSNSKFSVARYDTLGTLDPTFNTTGKATTTLGNTSFCTDMIFEPDGKIILAGNILNDFGCVRYNTNGTLDTTFGINGVFTIDFGSSSYDYGRSIVKQLDGKYIIGGTTSHFCSNRAFGLTRFSLANLNNTPFVSNNENFKLIPNPAQNYFELNGDETIKSVQIYSVIGQLVKSFNQQNQYEIKDLAKGTYIVKVNTTEGASNKTLLIE